MLATSTAGKFTTSRLVGWLETLPPQARVLDQIRQSPDSLLVQLVRNFVKNELVLKQADKFEVLAVNKLNDPIDASPVAVGKQLFLRGEKYLYCIEEP